MGGMDKPWLAGQLRSMRRAAGLSQRAVAERMPSGARGPRGANYIKDMELGHANVTIEEAVSFASICGYRLSCTFYRTRADLPSENFFFAPLVDAARELPDADVDLLVQLARALRTASARDKDMALRLLTTTDEPAAPSPALRVARRA